MSKQNWRMHLKNTNGRNGQGGDSNQPPETSKDDLTAESAGTQITGDGPVLRLQIDLHKLGRERALASGALQPRPADVESLRQLAEAMARETRRDTYDPVKRPQHRLREHEYQKSLTDRAETEDALKFSAAEVREKEEQLARLPNAERPKYSLPLMWAFVVGIGGTIAPTIHDFLFASIEDSVLSWFFSLTSAGFLAAVVVWSILGSISATGRRTKANWAGLLLGVVISAGLGLFRLAGTTETEEVVLAVALTLVEIGLVGLAEFVASGLREHYREWVAQQTVRDQASCELDAAKAEHQRRQDQLDALNLKITMHIQFVEDLDLRHVNLDELITAAVKAILDGYNEGLAINRGRVLKAGGVR